jgi:hypothetical protein
MIKIPVSVGELIDKITILEIKNEMIQDKKKLENVQKELNLLREKAKNIEVPLYLVQELKQTNHMLWSIEDSIRKKEMLQEFDQEFINFAREVYIKNDKRAYFKKKINIFTNSEIIEEKEYVDYE